MVVADHHGAVVRVKGVEYLVGAPLELRGHREVDVAVDLVLVAAADAGLDRPETVVVGRKGVN